MLISVFLYETDLYGLTAQLEISIMKSVEQTFEDRRDQSIGETDEQKREDFVEQKLVVH